MSVLCEKMTLTDAASVAEIAYEKGHRYLTVVRDLDFGRVRQDHHVLPRRYPELLQIPAHQCGKRGVQHQDQQHQTASVWIPRPRICQAEDPSSLWEVILKWEKCHKLYIIYLCTSDIGVRGIILNITKYRYRLISYLDPFVELLSKFGFTPNQITLISVLLGFSSEGVQEMAKKAKGGVPKVFTRAGAETQACKEESGAKTLH